MKNGTAQATETRYDVGPGFEIAVRSELNRPVEFQMKGEGEKHKPTLKGDSDHRHESLEKRLASIERALLMIVDQLKRIDERMERQAKDR